MNRTTTDERMEWEHANLVEKTRLGDFNLVTHMEKCFPASV